MKFVCIIVTDKYYRQYYIVAIFLQIATSSSIHRNERKIK